MDDMIILFLVRPHLQDEVYFTRVDRYLRNNFSPNEHMFWIVTMFPGYTSYETQNYRYTNYFSSVSISSVNVYNYVT